MVSSFLVALGFFVARKMGAQTPEYVSLVVTVATTTVVWVMTTFLTSPSDRAQLVRFYKLVRPAGPGWTEFRRETGLGPSPDSLPQAMLGWMFGCLFVYSALFGTGSFLYGRTPQAIMWSVLFVLSGIALVVLIPRLWSGGEALPSDG